MINYDENLLFYDVEVFKNNSLVVFKNIEGQTVKIFSTSLNGLGEYVDRGLITERGYKNLEKFLQGKQLVGYNNYFYDDYISYAMSKKLGQKVIKIWNDTIIRSTSKVNMKKIDICKTFDTFQEISISKPSLKKIEGNMGRSIVESDVDFNINRELTAKENLQIVKYCEYDVLQTIEVFKMRKDYFDSKGAIIEMLNDKKDIAYKWNTTSIVASLLSSKSSARHGRLVSDELLDLVDEEVAEMWRQLDTTVDFKFKKKKVTISEFGNSIEFGWGGLHGAPYGFIKRNDVRLADVASMYPNILINMRGLGSKTKDYKNILDCRLELKRQSKDKEQAPYKLVLNKTYGLLNNQYSRINNPHLAYSICIYGQISLYCLAQRLASIGCEIININTDGVAYCYDGTEDELIKKDWEKEFNLTLETDYFAKWIQKDVNNYIAVTEKGFIKVKGGDVNKYHENNYFNNNDIRISHLALVDYLVYEKPIQDTIFENLDKPILFQYVLKAGSTFKGVVSSEDTEKLLNTKVNRVFASKEGFEILKKRQDDGLVKFADAPNKMFLWNDDLNKLENFKDVVDVQWYYDLISKIVKRWGG